MKGQIRKGIENKQGNGAPEALVTRVGNGLGIVDLIGTQIVFTIPMVQLVEDVYIICFCPSLPVLSEHHFARKCIRFFMTNGGKLRLGK